MGSGSLGEIIESFNGVTGKETSDWTKDTSQNSLIQECLKTIGLMVYKKLFKLLEMKDIIGIVTSDTKRSRSISGGNAN